MKAQEVLRRYAAGERNFRNVNLRGANFKGQDLSSADFSGADIRSANFTKANLIDVNFTQAKAGLQLPWQIVQLFLIVVVAGLAGILQGFLGGIAAAFVGGSTEEIVISVVYISLVIAVYIAFSLQGFTPRAISLILIAVAFVVTGVVTGAVARAVTDAVTVTGTFAVTTVFAGAGTGAGAGAFAFAFAVTTVFVVAVIVAVAGIGVGTIAVTIVFAIAGAIAFTGTITIATEFAIAGAIAGTGAIATAFAFTFVGLLFSGYIAWRASQEDEKFVVVRSFGLTVSTIGGTSFRGSNLTRATFNQAQLNNTNFANTRKKETNLIHVCWQQAKKLNRAQLSDSILQNRHVRDILTTPEKGYRQDLSGANLRGANLSGITLEKANLKRAILSDALLTNAILKDAILTEAQAINTDFTGACLTGATLEAWNIDSTTTFKNIDCQYIFLTEQPNSLGVRERLPHNPDKVFQPGDFEKFFKEMLDDVQILIRNGIEPIAFRAAFQNIMQQHPDITQDAISRLERQGKDVLLTLQVPDRTDKAQLERDWDSGYQAGLKAGRDAERIESGFKFEKLALVLAEKNINIENRNEVMTGNNYSKQVNIQGNVDRASIVVGDNNQVSNQINQLNETETQTQLKELLTQLQKAIAADPILNEEEQTDALAEIGAIAQLGKQFAQSSNNLSNQKEVRRSLNTLRGIILGIGEVTHLTETAKPQLDEIAHLFNL